jgi:hypothetical protein
MKCVPTARVDVVSEAVPPLRATDPSEVTPSKNCTVPVGPEDGLRVAVKVTACPKTEGSNDEVNAVAVPTTPTACVTGEDVLPLKLLFPLYVAVMECVPAVSAAVVSEALPPLRATAPRELPPSKNCTVPVGPNDGLTVAVNVTDCPDDEGFSDDVNPVVVLA